MNWIISIFIVCSLSPVPTFAEFSVHNELQEFTSDGCSKFPDGIPLVNSKAWQQCCVVHDVAYWKGGTAEQRNEADSALSTCVAEMGHPLIGKAMYLGVRLGGYSGLPLTWHWGYGWKQERGYKKLSAAEMEQVNTRAKEIPENLSSMKISSVSALIPERPTITGDYCLDEIAGYLSSHEGDEVKIKELKESQVGKTEGWIKTFSVLSTGCTRPTEFTFLLLLQNACTKKSSELAARGRIRLQSVKPGCSKREENAEESGSGETAQ